MTAVAKTFAIPADMPVSEALLAVIDHYPEGMTLKWYSSVLQYLTLGRLPAISMTPAKALSIVAMQGTPAALQAKIAFGPRGKLPAWAKNPKRLTQVEVDDAVAKTADAVCDPTMDPQALEAIRHAFIVANGGSAARVFSNLGLVIANIKMQAETLAKTNQELITATDRLEASQQARRALAAEIARSEAEREEKTILAIANAKKPTEAIEE